MLAAYSPNMQLAVRLAAIAAEAYALAHLASAAALFARVVAEERDAILSQPGAYGAERLRVLVQAVRLADVPAEVYFTVIPASGLALVSAYVLLGGGRRVFRMVLGRA